MSFLVYYLILHLCVSMHACNSRHLGVLHKEPTQESTLVTTKTARAISEPHGGRHINEGDNSEQKTRKGGDMMVQVSQEENKIRVSKNHGRSTMESKPQDSKEAINKPKDNSFTEDVVVMDYAQPHRKPPIHNIEP